MTWNQILQSTQVLLSYLLPTLKVFFYTLVFSMPLGVVVAVIKKSDSSP